ncbi:hypothetical protein [Streptomyces sp. NPDC001422]|uniref:hypothetical protein n=1 Tax=Streptomyces sp. NPDC001422 TaxID=3364575 RepID=UPI0036A0718C
MAADEYIIQAVSEYWPNPETPCWAVDMIKPDGTGHRHVFPKVTLEYRAAEYDIDPTAVDQLLDIVLHEPYAPHPDDPLKGEDPAAEAGLLSPALVSRGAARKGDLIPTTLYTAPDAATAREAHLLRIEHGKANNVRVHAGLRKGKTDPLDVIRRNHGVDPARVAVKARAIEHRRLVAQGRAPQPQSAPAPTVKDDDHA